MPQVQAPARKAAANAAPNEQPKTDWILIEGSGRTVLKTIAGILRRSGDNSFSVEFRIFKSSAEKPAPQPKQPRHRRRGLGSLTSIFVPRRKRKH